MAAPFDLDAHEWPALPLLTEQAADADSSEVKTLFVVLMHCMHFTANDNQAAQSPCTPVRMPEPC